MKNVYDSFTKDEELSYRLFLKTIFEKLGFRKNVMGTKYLIELILFTYEQDYFTIFLNRICADYLRYKNIHSISQKQFLDNITYAIKNVDIYKFKNNFYEVFHTEYTVYYLSPKNILILCLSAMEDLKSR